MCRNPCSSGYSFRSEDVYAFGIYRNVAILVLVDIPFGVSIAKNGTLFVPEVAILVLVDIPFGAKGINSPCFQGQICRNPCSSGYSFRRRGSERSHRNRRVLVAILVLVDIPFGVRGRIEINETIIDESQSMF